MITAHPIGRVFWAGLLLILAAFTAIAQEFRGSLAGKIVDPNGAVVPGSKVEIKNIETGIVADRLTLDTGTVNTGTVVTGKQISELPLTFNVAEPQVFTVPTEAMRRGDFSALIKYYPLPNIAGVGNGTQNNFFSNQLRHQNYRAWLARIDHRISDNQSIFGKYYHSFNPEDRQDWAGVVNNFPITRGFEYRTNDGGNIDIRVSLNRFAQERRPAELFDPATLGFATRPIRSTLGATRSDWNEGRIRPFYMGPRDIQLGAKFVF